MHLPIACPFASLTYALAESDSLKRLFKRQLTLHQSSPEAPWNIILYTDEVTPGNPLATANQRRFHAVYWSLAELGTDALSHEESWFVLMTEFSPTVNCVKGGLSAVFAALIKTFFKEGADMRRGGISIELGEDDVRKLFALTSIVLQDGGAHKYVWGARGDGASKFCMLCKNLFTKDSEMVDEDGTNLLRCDVIKVAGLVPSSSRELRLNMRYLEQESITRSPDEFTKLQQALGLTYYPHGVLVDRELDDLLEPTEAYCHDWMHCLFVDGVVNLVIYLLFEMCINAGMDGVYESFSAYLSNWRFPARLHAAHLSDLFTTDRAEKHRAAKHIKCQASDLLTLLGPLDVFINNVLRPRGVALAACHAMQCLICLVNLIVAASRIDVDPDTMRDEVERFLAAFVAAFGLEWMTPKCHWLLHLPRLLRKFKRFFNCWPLERKHRVPKRYATELKNISSLADMSLLKECICHHFYSVKRFIFDAQDCLIDKHPASKRARKSIWTMLNEADDGRPINVATLAKFSSIGLCSRSDVVLLRDGTGFRAGRVQLNFEIENLVLSIVLPFKLFRKDANSSVAVWEVTDDTNDCWEVTDILASVEYCEYPNGHVATILPIEFR